MRTITRIALVTPLMALGWTAVRAQNQPNLAVPIEPVTAIVEAFRSHSVVALTVSHGQERAYALGLSLVRDPRFVAAVNDIVIEEGSARYQDVADRFVRGEEVSDESLSRVWRETTHWALVDGKPDFSKQIPRDQWRTLKAEDQFDAVLYTGPGPFPMVQPLPERCAEKADIEEHLRRLAMIGPPQSAEQLKQFCASVSPK